MTTTLTPFDFHSTSVRVVNQDGQAWFVLDDVIQAIGYSRSRDAARILDPDESGAHIVRVRSANGVEQDRRVTTVNESGIYHLALKSRKPAAQAFRKWVTGEVLPAIRRQGEYLPEQAAADKYALINAMVRQMDLPDDPLVVPAKDLHRLVSVVRKYQFFSHALAEQWPDENALLERLKTHADRAGLDDFGLTKRLLDKQSTLLGKRGKGEGSQ